MADNGPHVCPVCGDEFDSQDELQDHGDREHQDHDPEDESGPEGSGL